MKKAPILCLVAAASVLTLAAAVPAAAQTAGGDLTKIPAWLEESETYGFGVGLEAMNGTAWKFITHVPHSAEFLGEARRRGVRVFPYMTFYQAALAETYQEMRLSEHPDWILINANGRWAPTGFWESEDAKNMYCTCPNAAGYADAVLAYVKILMERGAAGIFLDNVHPNRECFGEKFGKHKHQFGTQIEAFADLMRRARELIKTYDPDGALLINSADPATLPAEFWPSTDAEMSESYICTWVATDRWGDWHKNWNGLDKKLPAGKQVCCLSYLGHDTKHSFKDDAFFCYASARLMNFIWGAGYDKAKVGDDSAMRTINGLTVGQPTAPETVADGVHYRLFKNGLVAVNPTDSEKKLALPARLPTSFLWDVYDEKEVAGGAEGIVLALPPQSGRVYLYRPSPHPRARPEPACPDGPDRAQPGQDPLRARRPADDDLRRALDNGIHQRPEFRQFHRPVRPARLAHGHGHRRNTAGDARRQQLPGCVRPERDRHARRHVDGPAGPGTAGQIYGPLGAGKGVRGKALQVRRLGRAAQEPEENDPCLCRGRHGGHRQVRAAVTLLGTVPGSYFPSALRTAFLKSGLTGAPTASALWMYSSALSYWRPM